MEELSESIEINRAWGKDSRLPSPILGRNVPRKPRLVGGMKGYDMKGNYLCSTLLATACPGSPSLWPGLQFYKD